METVHFYSFRLTSRFNAPRFPNSVPLGALLPDGRLGSRSLKGDAEKDCTNRHAGHETERRGERPKTQGA